jgi:hypothetical protein
VNSCLYRTSPFNHPSFFQRRLRHETHEMSYPTRSRDDHAFKFGQTDNPQYTSFIINQANPHQGATAYNHSGIDSSNPGWNSLDRYIGHSHSEQPGYNVSGDYRNFYDSSFVMSTSASNSAVVQPRGYYSQSGTQQSLETADTPPTPRSAAEGMQAQPSDVISLPDPMVVDGAPQNELLQGLDPFGQGTSSHHLSDCH